MLPAGEFNGAVGLFVSGTGTVILEYGSPRADATTHLPVNEWVQIELKDPSTSVNAEVDSLIVSASQKYGRAECVGINRIRARRTDSGSDDCYVSLGFGQT
jgi:hypothetical protein